MDTVDKAITTYEHADHSANNELYGIQSVFTDLLLKQLIVIRPANSPQTSSDSQAATLERLHNVTYPRLIRQAKSISRRYVRARDMWRNAIVKIDEPSARMEEIYDDFDDGIRAVEESMEDNKDFILNFANDVGE